jgi:DNA-binding MarR family transcriptional regulator
MVSAQQRARILGARAAGREHGTPAAATPPDLLDWSCFVDETAGVHSLPSDPDRHAAEPEPGSIQAAIRQTRPFRSRRQEAIVGLLLTAESVRWPLQDLLSGHEDLTPQQYNVLRILRGAGAQGLPTLEIGARMIERTPGVTRLIDRLEHKGLVARARSSEDRRQVLCRITESGRTLLRKLDRPVEALDDAVLGSLADDEVVALIRLLDKVRQHNRRTG